MSYSFDLLHHTTGRTRYRRAWWGGLILQIEYYGLGGYIDDTFVCLKWRDATVEDMTVTGGGGCICDTKIPPRHQNIGSRIWHAIGIVKALPPPPPTNLPRIR